MRSIIRCGLSIRMVLPPNEYEYNAKTGQYTYISDLGGNEFDVIHYTDGKSVIDRSHVEFSYIALNPYGGKGQRVGIGTTNPRAKLSVNGNILATEVKVQTDISVPDYVFEPDYELTSLAEVEAYVKEHKHLPEIPSAANIQCDGLDLAEMNLLLLKKVEELTLHLIEKEKQLRQVVNRLDKLEGTNP